MEVWAAGQQAGYLIATVWTIESVLSALYGMVETIACSSVQCSKISQLSARAISASSMHFVNLLNDLSVNYDENIRIEKYWNVALY